jgi:glutamyl-tRNA synthetase
MTKVRVRFAPSPTGPLHIGGVRTALYNYLFAKKNNGQFILRIEDTDQNRYVQGAEEYIIKSLNWAGLKPDEGPVSGGDFGPYRQSERKSLYDQYAHELVEKGAAYYAFDTPEDLENMRQRLKEEGIHTPKYDASTRSQMQNSLTLPDDDVQDLLEQNTPYVVRLLVEPGHTVTFEDEIRGEVSFESSELDDKVLYKADGMPTYHMANVIDDKHMDISHVIRGEEWLSSTAHHVLLYRALGWQEQMPVFAHLPLILKPTGKGKLSKRDGAKFGFPVFPMSWHSEQTEEHFYGFDAVGFDPKAMINFLALLGWNPGTEAEIFSMDGLIQLFTLDHIHKGGARFDYDKAKWFNQQYIQSTDSLELGEKVKKIAIAKGYKIDDVDFVAFCELMKTRATFYSDFLDDGYYFFEDVKSYDEKLIRKKWSPEKSNHITQIVIALENLESFKKDDIAETVKGYMEEHALGFGQVFPFLRISLSGTTKGPDLFSMMEILGKEKVCKRIKLAIPLFELWSESKNDGR